MELTLEEREAQNCSLTALILRLDNALARLVWPFLNGLPEVWFFARSMRANYSDEDAGEGRHAAESAVQARISELQAGRDLNVHENVLRKWVKDFGPCRPS
jgi:hypothetical protein